MLFGLPYYLILVVPFVGALLIPVAGRFSERLRDWMPVIFMGVSMAFAWSLLFDIGSPQGPTSWPWIPELGLYFEILLDPLSVVMGVLSSTLCFLIYVYSTEYMAGEEDRDRFFFLMLTFGGGMLTLVLSNNLLIAFIGWEIMGFCSYGLIGFWNDKKNPPEKEPDGTHCGTKAFIVTRIGDAFMLGGILLLFAFTHTFSFTEMAQNYQGWWQVISSAGMLVPTFLLIFMGAIGKSGQAPLQVWLPEAMAGPTSVSALIHAATMVKAGVYITARFLVTMVSAAEGGHSELALVPLQIPSLAAAAPFFTVVAVIGAITALMTASMGMVSNELKQILAFSTLSQLGYMMLAIGTAGLLEHYQLAYAASVLHVVSHGAFKALLFLASGGVIHALHTKYVTKMGGLKDYMPRTFKVMWIGVLALSGVPPFSGFWSKDSIIEYAYELAMSEPIGWLLFAMSVLAAACTIFYSLRLMGLTFYGPPHEDHKESDSHEETVQEHHGTAHDPGPAMMVPLYVLAAFTVVAFLLFPFIEKMLVEPVPMTLQMWLGFVIDMVYVKVTDGFLPFVVTMGALALGGIPAYTIYIRNADRNNTIVPERGVLRKIYTFLRHRWYINEAYYWILYRFLRLASWWRTRIDERVIDGIDFGSATAAIALSTRIRWFDDHVVDGLAEGISGAGLQLSESGQAIQTGRVNDYVSVLIFGVGLMLLILLIMVGVI
ncbi:MAG: NADH-quinone oxidoreductase subunit 5 family protein [Candidatus Thorarchaeota archaeon]